MILNKYSSKKLKRILIYPNITWLKDLSQDSFVQVVSLDIKCLNELRDDLWFYIIMPEHYKPFESFSNVTQLIVPTPSHPPQMRVHFDTHAIKSVLSNNLDFDLVFSHLPEHTHQLMSIMLNSTHYCPPVIGYAHWFDFKKQITWNKGAFNQNILGILEMSTCFINTQAQKDLVLQEARESFNEDTVRRLDSILRVCYLGVDNDIFYSEPQKEAKNIIAFNHRAWKYKDFDGFIRIMDKLYEQRQDFRAWVPLLQPGQIERPYIMTRKEPKPEYYRLLSKCCLAFAPKQTYAGWSISATDAMSNGCPVIFYDANYYRELNSQGDFFDSDEECLKLINKFFDKKKWRYKRALDSVEFIKNNRMHIDSARGLSQVIDETLSEARIVKPASTALPRLINIIKKHKRISKRDLIKAIGWGPSIMWTPYRNALMRMNNIFDGDTKEPVYIWVSDSESQSIMKKHQKLNKTYKRPHTLGPKVEYKK